MALLVVVYDDCVMIVVVDELKVRDPNTKKA